MAGGDASGEMNQNISPIWDRVQNALSVHAQLIVPELVEFAWTLFRFGPKGISSTSDADKKSFI